MFGAPLFTFTVQVKVPADTSNRPVTAIIYKTTKFYPDNVTVINVDSLFAGQFTGTASKNTVSVWSEM